jgi:eukaryotic-like serine/threonine-protein kinase
MEFRELTESYQLQKILKSHRFGTVLRATDNKSGRTVAVKLITVGPSPGLATVGPEFEKLAAALAGLGSPNVPTVLDSGFTTDGSAFLVFELMEGKGLDAMPGTPPARVLSLIGQALDGLEALASRGLAHHNVSPDNLFVVSSPGGEQVSLLGLGTAVFRPRGPEAAAGLGAENARFRAPELAGGVPADWRADLFSLALTACHALGATVGFGESPVVQLPLAVSFELESDDALRKVLERCLRQSPGERPTPREFREALRQALGAPEMAPPAPRPVPPIVAPHAPVAVQAPAPLPLVIPDAWVLPPAASPATAVAAAPAPFANPGLLPDPLPSTGASPDAFPKEEGDVLSSVDDEILNALLSVPAPPPRPPGPPAKAGKSAKVVPFVKKAPASSEQQPAPAPAAGPVPLLRRPAVLGAVAGAVVLFILGAFWFFGRPEPTAVAAPDPAAAALPKPPTQPPVDRLQEAALFLGQGEDLKARRVLRSIALGEQGLLSAAGCRELSVLEETLGLAAIERLPADLASGLKGGDLEVLRNAVDAGMGQEAGLSPAVRSDFDRARGVVEAYGQAQAAAAGGNSLQVLERFAALTALLPKANDPEGLRDKAAKALETEADAMVREARYPEALTRLSPLQRTWPDRSGLKERLARYQAYQQNEREQETLLAALPGLERRKKPTEALEALRGVEPTPHLAARFGEARARLENLLARLDQQPPELVLREGFLLDYSRGTVAELSFRATDDYEVKSVKVLGRPEGGKFRELPLEKNRAGYYTVEITPSFHQNGTVDLYGVATDVSGHETYLGSREKPLQLKRKQGFERLIR